MQYGIGGHVLCDEAAVAGLQWHTTFTALALVQKI